jgi:hypothetical protein
LVSRATIAFLGSQEAGQPADEGGSIENDRKINATVREALIGA